MKFMRAHGASPGPTERPYLAGALSGLAGSIVAIPMMLATDAIAGMERSLGIDAVLVTALQVGIFMAGGALYARVFSRAAADPGGAWLFGLASGYVLWMFGPATAFQWAIGHPLALGHDALAILGGYMLHGLALGLVYPSISGLLLARLDHGRDTTVEAQKSASARHR